MDAQLEQIREQQRESWNKSSVGWKKWSDLTMSFLKPFGDEIIRELKLKDSDLVLDVAAGTGEPGLTIAGMLKNGRVISTDLAEGMLEVAKENATKRGITNFEATVCDVSELPFPDNTFDAVSCRFGYMFFPDMLLATKEIVRVLKPGGRIAASVWEGPEKNFWLSAAVSTINKYVQLPSPAPGAPGMYRCAAPRMMADLFEQAGLRNVTETEVAGNLNTGTSEMYWTFASDQIGPIVTALSNADEAMRSQIKEDIICLVSQRYPDGKVAVDAGARVIYGEK